MQGVAAFADVKDIPDTDLAILAIPAALCPEAVEMLAAEKQVKDVYKRQIYVKVTAEGEILP